MWCMPWKEMDRDVIQPKRNCIMQAVLVLHNSFGTQITSLMLTMEQQWCLLWWVSMLLVCSFLNIKEEIFILCYCIFMFLMFSDLILKRLQSQKRLRLCLWKEWRLLKTTENRCWIECILNYEVIMNLWEIDWRLWLKKDLLLGLWWWIVVADLIKPRIT